MRQSIVEQLAHSLKRKDQQPNIDLAARVAKAGDKDAIACLMEIAQTGSKPERYDAIKVIYEIGRIEPQQLALHGKGLIGLLSSRENRMLWGVLQALETLAYIVPELLAKNLNAILLAADRSSVIAMDKSMSILVKLNAEGRFREIVTPILLQRLSHSAPNQFPTYGELTATTIGEESIGQLLKIIDQRLSSIASPAKRKRLQKVKSDLLEKQG